MATTSAEVLTFRFNATVIANDGDAGSLTHVDILPGQRTIVALGVKIPGGKIVSVPIARVEDAHADEITLSISRESLAQVFPAATSQSTQLTRSTTISQANKSIGSLMQVSMTASDTTLRSLVIHRRLGGNSIMPQQQIQSISDSGNQIMTSGNTDTFVAFRNDSELKDDVYNRLWNYPRLRIDLHSVDIRVNDGEVWLRGFVSSTINRRIIENLLINIKGMIVLHNYLVDDTDLSITISRALANDPRTRNQSIGVYSTLGKVALRGMANDESVALAATQIAQQVNADAVITNQLAHHAGQFIPIMAPVTNREDVVPGGE